MTFPGHILDCINVMTLTNFFNYFIIVYIFLETLLYTVFITTILNGNYIIIIFVSKNFALLAIIVVLA